MKRLILIGLLVISQLASIAILPKDDKKKGDEEVVPIYNDGVVYALPRIGFIVEVEAEETMKIPGPFMNYAQKYLGLTDVVRKKETEWQVVDIKISTFSEADPNAVFETSSSAPIWISLMPNGVISGVNVKGESSPIKMQKSTFIKKKQLKTEFGNDLSSHDFYDIILDSLTGDEKMISKSLETKAQEAADYLIKLRKRKIYEIVDSYDELPTDGKAYDIMTSEIEKVEIRYSELFAGKEITRKEKASFVYIPEGKKSDIIFRFSEDKGILPVSDISGKPVMIEIKQNDKIKNRLNGFKSSANPETGKHGLYYRVPVSAIVSITNGLDVLSRNVTTIPQFGELLPVPAPLLDGSYAVKFNPFSGVISGTMKLKE